MPNLEGQLGELTGHLRALVPTLEKVEARQNEDAKIAAGEKAKLEALRSEFNDLRQKVSARIGEHYKSLGLLSGKNVDRKNEIETLQADVKDLKDRNDGFKQKIWEVVKIVITAVLSVTLTLLASKLLGK